MVELMIENGASKGEPGAARKARDEWVQQFGRGKVPDLCTFRRNYKKWKTEPTGVLNLHAFVRKVSALLFLKSGFWGKQVRKKFSSFYNKVPGQYGNMGCGVFKRGVKNYKDFCLRINILKGNYWILRIGLVGRCQKVQNHPTS